jgi:EAL and modified HD-GYP domain-containing signal transduction protein
MVQVSDRAGRGGDGMVGPVSASSRSPQVHVGRQAIHDAQGSVVGYELLFRSGPFADRSDQDGDAATSATILAAFSEFGAHALLADRPGFINLTQGFLKGTLPLPFGPDAAVLEVQGTLNLDYDGIVGAQRLVDDGYRLALDDFVFSPKVEPLLALADIVKIDVLRRSWEEVLLTLDGCRPHKVRLLAEKVETREMLSRCIDAGFELFQGYHLGRPETVTTQTLSPEQISALALLMLLDAPGVTTTDIDAYVRRSPALVYRLLRIVNSAASGVPRKVASIRDAVVMVGMNRLRSWMILLALSPGGSRAEGLAGALIRARTCELVARASGIAGSESAFTVGLLHGVAEAMDLTPAMLLERMPALAPDLSSALFGGPGPLQQVLDAVLRYELGQDARPDRALPQTILVNAYLEALAWTTETTAAVRPH